MKIRTGEGKINRNIRIEFTAIEIRVYYFITSVWPISGFLRRAVIMVVCVHCYQVLLDLVC